MRFYPGKCCDSGLTFPDTITFDFQAANQTSCTSCGDATREWVLVPFGETDDGSFYQGFTTPWQVYKEDFSYCGGDTVVCGVREIAAFVPDPARLQFYFFVDKNPVINNGAYSYTFRHNDDPWVGLLEEGETTDVSGTASGLSSKCVSYPSNITFTVDPAV